MTAAAEAMVAACAEDDARFMASALALGRRGLGNVWPNPAVGALLVRRDSGGPVILARGWTQPGGRPHAEIEALARAGSLARGATLYVTLEPCAHHGRSPPCADAIIAAGVSTVVSALEDPNPEVAGRGHARLDAAGIAVRIGVGAAEAERAHAGHIRRMRERRPEVTLKLAVSADGKAGLAGRRPAAITGERARERVHLLRGMHDAILIGIGTALADDPLLTCRLPGMTARSPMRVVLDATLRLPLDGRLAATAKKVPLWILTAASAAGDRGEALRARGAEVIEVGLSAPGRLDLAGALRLLADRGITRLMVEGGPIVAASMLAGDLVDEAALFEASAVIGADGIDALDGMPVSALTRSPRFKSIGIESVGSDRLQTFVRA
jgi:diaminohydroxyphosphoribosylaminopyrimidine deaminase / 5-amino-6-(5-phosphoribosylamino)uracil reductase